jgi:alpha-ribazole phosphatase
MPITTIDLLRHGAVQGGTYYRGRTDDPLSAEGWQQMRPWLAQEKWTQVVSSPLCRCLDFAKEISQLHALPLQIEARFQEIDFGDWEGKTAAEIDCHALQRFYQNPLQNPPPHGENLLDFQQRIAQAWQDLLKTSRGETILLITHAGVIRTLFCQLLNVPLERCFAIDVSHASLSRFRHYHDEAGDFVQLNFHNRLI